MSDVIKKLQQLNESDEYPFHMPGHKRNYNAFGLADAYGIDITEIVGYDNLYEAEGMLKDAMERAAKVYGAEETFFLVNGSTVGILSAITGVTKYGERILVARNCHKAVYHSIYLRELEPVFLYPVITRYGLQGQILLQDIKKAFAKNPGRFGSKLITVSGLKVVQIFENEYWGAEHTKIIAHDVNYNVYYVYLYGYCENVYENSYIQLTALPLDYFTYPNTSGKKIWAIACAGVMVE